MRVLYPGQKLEFGVLVFVEGGKPENPEKNPESKDESHQETQPTYDTRLEMNPGHIVLSPLRHPCSPKNLATPENLTVTCIPRVEILII